MDEVILNEGLDIQNNPQYLYNESSSFKEQLYANIKRNLIPLMRSKSNFIIEAISSLSILIVYILLFQTYIFGDNSKYKDYTSLLSTNNIYVDKETKEYFENSFFVKHKKLDIKYKLLNFQPTYKNNINETIQSFRNEFYKKNKLYNEKIAIFKHETNDKIEFFLLYQQGNNYYKNLMNTLASSAYFSSLGINTIIFDEYANFPVSKTSYDKDEFAFSSSIILVISFLSFSGFSLNIIVKEKEINVKHLIYLSGGNMNSYWLGFLITDMIRYLILIFIAFFVLVPFNFVVFMSVIPVFITFSLAMSMFIYVFSFFIDKEEHAQKSYFKFLILFFIICCSLMILIFYII
jgi:hypothetical protein